MGERIQDKAPLGLLRARVSKFVGGHAAYKDALREFFYELRNADLRAVIFGGTLRDLLVKGNSEQPRDVDLVVDTPSLENLEHLFRHYLKRRTRFGGLHLNVDLWPIDIWPLRSTWAFQSGQLRGQTFADLPDTTFLDVEAAAIELWPAKGHPRIVFETHFFRAIERRTVDVNYLQNPFPDLCVVRALLTAARLDFGIGASLVRYLCEHGSSLSPSELERIQIGHYGKVRCDGRIMYSWIEFLRTSESDTLPIRLPVSRPLQLSLWQDWNPSC